MSRVTPARPRPLRGILMIMTAVAMFSVMDSMAKYLSRYYPVPGIVWARYAFHLLFVVLILGPRMRLGLVRTKRPGLQIVRGMLLAASSMLFFSALKFMPMAEASSISFVAPMLVTLLGVFLLKEKVEPARWVAVAAGFIGVLIIIRPGSGIFAWVAVLPLATAACFASYQILTRKLAGVDGPYTSLFYSGLVGTVMLAAVLPFQWTTPTTVVHALMLPTIGFIGGLSHLILIRAYDQAAVSTLAPFSYTQLIWVILIGYLVFGDFPDRWSLIGIAVIMASGIYIATHQHLSERLQRAELQESVPGA
ncbi:MAG: DMT family transporter [Burkholderiales bacterium]